MNSLFASNFLYSFHMFALTLFSVTHTLNSHKEVFAPQKGLCHFIVLV